MGQLCEKHSLVFRISNGQNRYHYHSPPLTVNKPAEPPYHKALYQYQYHRILKFRTNHRIRLLTKPLTQKPSQMSSQTPPYKAPDQATHSIAKSEAKSETKSKANTDCNKENTQARTTVSDQSAVPTKCSNLGSSHHASLRMRLHTTRSRHHTSLLSSNRIRLRTKPPTQKQIQKSSQTPRQNPAAAATQ